MPENDFGRLKNFGFFLNPVIQIDPTSAWINNGLAGSGRQQSTSCDHNCTVKNGGYNCVLAKSLNPAVNLSTVAPVGELFKGLENAVEALKTHRQKVFQSREAVARRLNYSLPLLSKVASDIAGSPVTINFIGEPTRHPQILSLIAMLNSDNQKRFTTTLTTTGIKFLNRQFYDEFTKNPSDVLAMSLDDLSSLGSFDEIRRLAKLASQPDKKGFLAEYNKLGKPPAQRHKAFEAIFAATLFKDSPDKPGILFNVVVHKGNLGNIFELIFLLRELFPKAKINPYPAQSAHEIDQEKQLVNFTPNDLPQMEKLVNYLIERRLDNDPGFTSRLPYLLFWKAIIETNKDNPGKGCRMLSGFDAWRCYDDPMASSCFQIGAASEVSVAFPYPGMNPRCFWEPKKITDPAWQVSQESFSRSVDYLQGGMKRLSLTSSHDCTCIMPRIMGSEDSIIGGMSDELKPVYLKLRRKHVEF